MENNTEDRQEEAEKIGNNCFKTHFARLRDYCLLTLMCAIYGLLLAANCALQTHGERYVMDATAKAPKTKD